MRIEVSTKEAKEAELSMVIQDHKFTRDYLKQKLWDITADGHARKHKNCELCEVAKEIVGTLNG